jgi:hypothetical protein
MLIGVIIGWSFTAENDYSYNHPAGVPSPD